MCRGFVCKRRSVLASYRKFADYRERATNVFGRSIDGSVFA